MARLVRMAGPLAILVLLTAAPGPAKAQMAGFDQNQMMTQFAPMLEMMKQKMGKRRFGQMMATVGPMMADMMDQSGGAGGFGGFGGMPMFGSGQGMEGMMGMMSSFDFGALQGLIGGGSRRHGRRPGKRAHGAI